jgi:hypothetical protein
VVLLFALLGLSIILGSPVAALGLVFLRKNRGFNRRAVRVTGSVVGHEEVYSTAHALHRRIHFPVVRYAVEGGAEHQAKAPGEDEPLAVGSPVELLVDPQHPDQVSFTGPRGGAGVAAGLVGAGCLLMMLGVGGALGLVVLMAFA